MQIPFEKVGGSERMILEISESKAAMMSFAPGEREQIEDCLERGRLKIKEDKK